MVSFSNTKSVNDEHPSNADDPIVINVFDLIITWVKVTQFLNELLGIFFIFPFIVIDLIPRNALLSMLWIDEGNIISFNDEHPSNDDDPIEVRLFVINVICFKVEQFLNESFGIIWMSLLIVKFSTPRNAFSLIIWIDDGILICNNDVHPSKAEDPMDFKLL